MSTVPAVVPVGAVVTAFRPTSELLDALAVLRHQVDLVVVVDDAGGPASPVLERAASDGVVVIRHRTNRGIAAALNTGIAELRGRLPELAAVLTCDQDSQLPAGYVAELRATWLRASRAGIAVGMVAPKGAGNIRRLPGTAARDGGSAEVRIGGEPIQSGLLIPSATLEAVGEFDESLFIDSVDSDFYLRAVDAGLVPVVASVSIGHQLGRTTPARLGPLRINVTVAADYRYYYRMRNLVEMARRHGRRHPGWVLRAFGKELRHLAITTLLVPGRRRRVANTARGLRDGARGRLGRIQPQEVDRA